MAQGGSTRNGSRAVKLRVAESQDVDAIVRVEGASFSHPKEQFNRRQIASLIRNPRAVVSVGVWHGRVLGWAAGLVRRHARRRSGRIYAIAVDPDARGLRMGRRLLERTLRGLRQHGAEAVFLEVRWDNQPAIGLYEKLGFVHRHRLDHYYGWGRHGQSMVHKGG